MASRMLYLVRHGVHEKDPTAKGPDGNEDGELTEAGREQARLLEHGSQQAAAAVRRHARGAAGRRAARTARHRLPGGVPGLIRLARAHQPTD